MRNRVCKEDQIKLIMECRKSGLSDYQWCVQNRIHPGNFYNWVSKLRKNGYTFPESASKSNASPNVQEVVKMDFVQCRPQESSLIMQQNVSLSIPGTAPVVAAELLLGNITLRLFNGTDEHLIQSTLRSIGGLNNAW